jgi:hypothetical protein
LAQEGVVVPEIKEGLALANFPAILGQNLELNKHVCKLVAKMRIGFPWLF